MSDKYLICGLQYATYALEAVVCLLLAHQARWRRLKGLCLYVVGFFLLDGVARPAVLNYFGWTSVQYRYFYWLTDVVFALGAFLLICAFFRRACAQEVKMWALVRLLLVFVFILVLGFSALSLTRNYTHLYSTFIIEFSQNLYFSCLVLNTLLYIMIQQFAIDDDELGLLVAGLGVQFAGEAAGLALLHVTLGDMFAKHLFSFLNPVCTLGMLAVWVYAIAKTPQKGTVRLPQGENRTWVPAVAE